MRHSLSSVCTLAFVSIVSSVAAGQTDPAAGTETPAVAVPEAAPAVQPVEPAAKVVEVAAPSTPMPAASPPAAPAAPSKLAVGTSGLWQPGMLLQGWMFFERTGEDPVTERSATRSTVRLRRAEVSFKAKIVPEVASGFVMFDLAKVLEPQDKTVKVDNQNPSAPAGSKGETVTVKEPKGALSVLQDFGVTYETSYADVTLGQFKIPTSLEGFGPSYALYFPERAPVVVAFGDRRDMGLRVSKKLGLVRYTAGVFNGAGVNNLDGNNSKDVTLRLDVYPFAGLSLGAVAYRTVAQSEQARRRAADDRYEADIRFESHGVLFQGELIRARTGNKKKVAFSDSQGWYAMLGYTVLEGLQPVVRVSFFDPLLDEDLIPATASDSDELTQYEAGLNYYLSKNEAKLQLAYARLEYDDKPAVNRVIVAAQLWY